MCIRKRLALALRPAEITPDHCQLTFAHSGLALYAEEASDSNPSGARQNPDRLRHDDGPSASGLSGVFRRLECVCPPVHRDGGQIDGFRTV
jgi:hypothetical protein